MLYVSVDVEASGHIPGIHNLVSIGATPVRETGGRFEMLEDFYVELKPVFPGFSPEAMAVHGIPREHLEKNGLEPAAAMSAFREFVIGVHGGGIPKPVFVGHNAAFDWAYINFYFAHMGVRNPFNIFPMDIKALSMARLAIPWARARKTYLKQALKLEDIDEKLRHRADYDARYQARMFTGIMKLIFNGSSSDPRPEEITPED